MKLDEGQLYRAAALADAMELALLPDTESCPKHEFSDEFERKMQELIGKIKRNEIRPYKVFLGWQYYAKRSIAALLICFLLACITVPEAVVAGYYKLLDAIERIVTEYTEYQYQSETSNDRVFEEVKFGYMPDGMTLTKKYIGIRKIRFDYKYD